VLYALRDTIVFFYAQRNLGKNVQPGTRLRLGRLVEKGSISKQAVPITFCDAIKTLTGYTGQLPDLFREGGALWPRCFGCWCFHGRYGLAKHDENYAQGRSRQAEGHLAGSKGAGP
jgi:cytochrome c-type biogenesis protein CcmE